MADTRDLKSLGVTTVRVRAPPPAPLRNDLCMSDDRLGRVHLDSKGLSSFKPAIASLDCGFVFQIWQLIHSVHMAQLRNAPFGTSPRLAARSLSRTGRFFASASRPRCWVVMQGYEVRTCSAAPRFKTVTASLGHSFVPPTWKLIHRVHMTRKKSFCPERQKLFF